MCGELHRPADANTGGVPDMFQTDRSADANTGSGALDMFKLLQYLLSMNTFSFKLS